jgi:hypothetical protein
MPKNAKIANQLLKNCKINVKNVVFRSVSFYFAEQNFLQQTVVLSKRGRWLAKTKKSGHKRD